ncbi:MAG: N-acetylmuramoyl-L-alanine amidase [Deltaproteobacteria bacterium]|nr:N-acetylmuramoyl-L-alanine amidase [Deltaproteobacteria bacterium]
MARFLLLAILALAACAERSPPAPWPEPPLLHSAPLAAPAPPAAPARWPAPGVLLQPPRLVTTSGYAARRVYLDPGHRDADGRDGGTGAYCQLEADFALELAQDLGRRLEQTGAFIVRLAREPGEIVAYAERVARAEAWGADAYLGLHSDVRGPGRPWSPRPGKECSYDESSPGFSIIWSDVAPAGLRARRQILARAVARALGAAGFLPCACREYVREYRADEDALGLFVDRRPSPRRIQVLERNGVPAILVETHNARDPHEAQRWQEEHTREVFAAVIAAALREALAGPSAETR